MSRDDSIESRCRWVSTTHLAALAATLLTASWLAADLAAAEDAPAAKPEAAAAATSAADSKYRQLLAGIELTDEQRDRIDKIDDENRAARQGRREEAAALREKHREAKQAGNETEAKEIRAKIQAIAKTATGGQIDQIREVLDAGQQAQLDANLEQMKAQRAQKRAERAAKRSKAN